MANTITASPATSNASCPITRLPPELRDMIYDYYFESMETTETESRVPGNQYYYYEDEERTKWRCAKQIDGFHILKPYFSILHLSRMVRSENAEDIYATAFTDVWFNFEIDNDVNDIERMKGMFAQIRSVNKDVKFGLHFAVRDHTPKTFYQFKDCFFGMRGDSIVPTFIRCEEDSETGSLMLSNATDAKIEYTYKSPCKDYYRLWMFGSLARLDWSTFEFNVPPPMLGKARLMDDFMDYPTRARHFKGGHVKNSNGQGDTYDLEDGVDFDVDSENEVVAFNNDDDDDEAMYFDGADQELVGDEDGEESVIDSEDEGGQFDGEDDRISLDGGDEDWW